MTVDQPCQQVDTERLVDAPAVVEKFDQLAPEQQQLVLELADLLIEIRSIEERLDGDASAALRERLYELETRVQIITSVTAQD